MTRTAEKLALAGLGNQVCPCSCQLGADVEALGARIYVIELKAIGRSAPNAATAEQLDEASTAAVLVRLDVGLEVLGSSGHTQYLTKLAHTAS
jgi:hypothetical protein